jgi:hypothetical protein
VKIERDEPSEYWIAIAVVALMWVLAMGVK